MSSASFCEPRKRCSNNLVGSVECSWSRVVLEEELATGMDEEVDEQGERRAKLTQEREPASGIKRGEEDDEEEPNGRLLSKIGSGGIWSRQCRIGN